MKLRVKSLNEKAVIPFKTHNDDFAYDVVAVSEEQVAPNVWKYGLGLAFQIVRDEEFIMKEMHSHETIVDIDGTIVETDVFNPKFFDFANSPMKLSIGLRPRSSVWKTGMVLSDCEGTIDEGYTGEVSAVFYHVNTELPRYKVGDKIGQIKLDFTLPIEFEVVDELNKTERGEGSYGSTGK